MGAWDGIGRRTVRMVEGNDKRHAFIRDPFGEHPLHYAAATTLGEPDFVCGTTAKACHQQGAVYESIRMAPPGSAIHWDGKVAVETYYTPQIVPNHDDRPTAAQTIKHLLGESCLERKPAGRAAILLSGGIDSAAVAVGLLEAGADLEAYTAVHNPRSPDLKAARLVADHLGIKLNEIPVPVPTLEDLRHTIKTIEQPWKAQVEIGWACLVLAEAIAADGHATVYSGEGADELFASHMFSWHEMQRPGAPDWYRYRLNDFTEQAYRNFAREAKTFASFGVTTSLPFLHVPLVEYILGLSKETCRDRSDVAKVPLQLAFRDQLPEWISRRRKIGFQDGLKIKPAIKHALQANPVSVYRREYRQLFPGLHPD